MKPKLTLLFTLLSLAAFPQTEWAPIGAKWYFSRLEGMNPPNQGYVVIESTKDTVIQEKLCRVLNKTYYNSDGEAIDLGNKFTYQDSSRVFYWGNGKFYKLYDFNAKIGDSWEIYSDKPSGCGFDSIGTIQVVDTGTSVINNKSLKFIEVEPFPNSLWTIPGRIYEVIGSVFYMFADYVNNCGLIDDLRLEGPLRCYIDSFIGLYRNIDIPCDTLIKYNDTKIKGVKSITNSYDLFPNPFSGSLHIKPLYFNKNSRYTVQIVDTSGQLVFNQITQQPEYIINTSNFKTGIYFLIINAENSVFYRKILKIDKQ